MKAAVRRSTRVRRTAGDCGTVQVRRRLERELERVSGKAVAESNTLVKKKCGLRTAYYITESLILAQNERWRRGLGMQVERERERNIPSGMGCSLVEWRTGE